LIGSAKGVRIGDGRGIRVGELSRQRNQNDKNPPQTLTKYFLKLLLPF
jgi:hypothetical protein